MHLVLEALRKHDCGPKRNGKGWTARCPAHDDKRPSLSIGEGSAGRALVHCHAGCTPEAITAALGMTPADLTPDEPPARRPGRARAADGGNGGGDGGKSQRYFTSDEALAELRKRHGEPAGRWEYHDAKGVLVGLVLRWDKPDGKLMLPVSRRGSAWALAAMEEKRPLYRLPALLAADAGRPVLVVEGEKCADMAAGLGLLATTSAGGANAAKGTDWGPLAGREVVIVPDNDEAGAKYAADVARLLLALNPPARVRILNLAEHAGGLPPGGDIADVLDADDWCGLPLGDTAEPADVGRWMLKKAAELRPVEGPGPVLRCLADVEPRKVQWLWPGRFPLGRITLLVGRPGEGKSFLSLDMAARVSTGTQWPDRQTCPKGSVIIISAEDDPADTIRPRLDAMYADVKKVHLLSMVRRLKPDGTMYEALFTLADAAALEAALRQTPDCRLVVVDPIGSFLGGDTDAHRDNEVRNVLVPLAMLAEKYGVAVVAIAHRRKTGGSVADDLALGSRAFTGVARAVWHLTRDREHKARRLLLPGKNNLAPEGDGLAFTIEGDPPGIVWERDPVPMNADDALAAENDGGRDDDRPGPEPEARNQAAEWLRELLKAGPMEAAKVRAEGEAAGYAWRTLHRAKDELGIRPCRERFGGNWMWKLPDAPTCQDPGKQENLASWHDRRNPKDFAGFQLGTIGTCQDVLSWHDSSAAGPADLPPEALGAVPVLELPDGGIVEMPAADR